MSNLKITVEVSPGGSIAEACAELQGLANRLGITACASMNGVKCMAFCGGDAVLLAERQQRSQGGVERFKIATSIPEKQRG